MKIFLDGSVLVSVLNKEYPLFSHSARILSLAGQNGFEVFTSPLCLAIAFYFAEKKNKKTVLEKIKLLARNISITPVTSFEVKQATENVSVKDFEDALEYYSATAVKCDCIITEDTGDFYFSKVEVLNCRDFFEKYLRG